MWVRAFCTLFLIVFFLLYSLGNAQVFIPFGFWSGRVFVAGGTSTSVQCPTTLTGSLSINLPYTGSTGAATSCSIAAQSPNFIGVPICLCSAGVCTATGLTLSGPYLSAMNVGVNNSLSGALTYSVGSVLGVSLPASLNLNIITQTWNPNCLGSNLKLWTSAMNSATVTSTYNATGQYGSGTSGSSSFTSAVPPTYPIGSFIKLAGNAQVYEVTSQSLQGAGNFNGDLEKPILSPGSFKYYNSMTSTEKAEFGWIASNGAVVFSNGSAWNYPTVPSGVQGMSMQNTARVEQSIYFPTTGTFTLSWYAVRRPGYAANPYSVWLNGVTIFGPATPTASWAVYSVGLVITTVGYHKITFDTYTTSGDNCLGLDYFRLDSTIGVTPNLAQTHTNAEISLLGVSSWRDNTSNGNDLTQTISSANYPGFTANYQSTGKPAILFNGGSQFLTKASASVPTSTSDSTHYIVAAQAAPSGSEAKYALSYGGTSTNQARMIGKLSATNGAVVSTQSGSLTVASGTWGVNALNIFGSSFTAGTLIGSMNGNTESTATVAFSTPAFPGLWLGRSTNSSNTWSGGISEVMIISSGLSDGERRMIEGYLATKYNIFSVLPVAHKYKTFAP